MADILSSLPVIKKVTGVGALFCVVTSEIQTVDPILLVAVSVYLFTLLIDGGKYVPEPIFGTILSIIPPEPSGSENIFERELVIVHEKSTLQPLGTESTHGGGGSEDVGGLCVLEVLFHSIIFELYAGTLVGKVITCHAESD